MSVMHNAPLLRIGVVLAGGRSSRMGKDKALLSLDGKTLLDRTVSTLSAAGCSDVLLSGYPRSSFTGIVIPDATADAGPVAGISSCLKYVAEHYAAGTECLFIAVDMPNVSSDLLNTLTAHSQICDGAYFEHHPLPFSLRLTDATAALATSSRAIDSGAKSPSIRAFLAPLRISRLQPDPDQRQQLLNINTPEDWEKIVNSL